MVGEPYCACWRACPRDGCTSATYAAAVANADDLPAALAAFEVTLEEDLQRGEVASAAAYAHHFPGFEAEVERAYERRMRRRTGAASAAGDAGLVVAAGSMLGPYRLEREVGRGGQGAVFLAEDTRLSRRVAIKVLDRLGPMPAETLRRFAREGAIVSRLDHPALCALFDTGEHAGTPFLVMRYVEGETLARSLARARDGEGFLAPARSATGIAQRRAAILTLVEAVARALHVAHEVGVVHRDVKPGNVMVTPGGAPVVLDFGLALDERDEGLTLTRSGDVLGTPFYMAPEQLATTQGPVDRRTDVWALGVVLYECLTLRRPFSAPTTTGLVNAVLYDPVPPTRAAGAPQPRDLEVVIATALERDRGRRYQSAQAFADDLGRILRHEPIRARPASLWLRSRRWMRRHPGHAALVVLIAFALSTLAAAAGFYAARRPLLERGAQAARAERLETALSEGYFTLWEHDADRAAERFRAVLAEADDDAEAVAGLALAASRSGGGGAGAAILDQHASLLAEYAALRRLRAHLCDRAADGPLPGASDTALDFFVAGLVEMERARVLLDRRRAERAVDLFTGAMLRSPTARSHYVVMRGSVAGFTARRAEVARETATILEGNWPERPSATYWAAIALGNSDPAEAIAAFRRAWERAPDDERCPRQLTLKLAFAGKDAEALAVGTELVRRWPHLATSHEALAAVHEVANRLDLSAAAAREATRLDPHLPLPYCMLASAYEAGGDHASARATLRACLAATPGNPQALAQLAQLEVEAGEMDEGLALYASAQQRDPFPAVVWWNVGELLVQCGRLHEGEVAFLRARELGGIGGRMPAWWPADADQLIVDVRARVVAVDDELAGFDGGTVVVRDPERLVELAEAATFRSRTQAAAKLWELALAEPATDELRPGSSRRTRAARAAAATGEPAWRERARGWLAAELADWQAARRAGAVAEDRMLQRVARWREDPVLAPVLPAEARSGGH